MSFGAVSARFRKSGKCHRIGMVWTLKFTGRCAWMPSRRRPPIGGHDGLMLEYCSAHRSGACCRVGFSVRPTANGGAGAGGMGMCGVYSMSDPVGGDQHVLEAAVVVGGQEVALDPGRQVRALSAEAPVRDGGVGQVDDGGDG